MMVMMMRSTPLLLLLVAVPLNGWVLRQTTTVSSRRAISETGAAIRSLLVPWSPGSSSTALLAGGFGGSSGSSKSKETKLKPKQQWDRFLALKTQDKFRVAVKSLADDSEWLEVGSVKSTESAHTDYAVARQRSLIVDHARRLFPLQLSAKDTVQWAYWSADDWVVVDKVIMESADVPTDVEKGKAIGFEGRADPSTGFYCLYNEGKLVNGASEVRAHSSRKRE